MPTEPERDIEKALRACADKRREEAGAPRELHPATRRLLQGEVARLRGKPRNTRAGWWRIFFGSPARATVSVGCALVLLAAAWPIFISPTAGNKAGEHFPLARNRRIVRPVEVVAVPASGDGNVRKALDYAPDKSAKDSIEGKVAAKPAGVVPSVQIMAAGQRAGGVLTTAAAAAAPPETPGGSKSSAASEIAESGAPFVVQRFYRLNQSVAQVPGKKLENSQMILNAFKVEQTGDRMKVIDGDGSIYSGSVQLVGQLLTNTLVPITNAGMSQRVVQSQANANGGQNAQASQAFFFNVSGSNLSLKEPVIFTGNFVAGPEPANRSASFQNGNSPRQQNSGSNAGQALFQLNNSLLQGRATVGGSNQLEINAAPANP